MSSKALPLTPRIDQADFVPTDLSLTSHFALGRPFVAAELDVSSKYIKLARHTK